MARVTKDAEDRREDILNATLDLIEEQGIDRVRGADLAKRLGVSSGLIFYHFENLQTLVISAIRYATEREMENLQALLDDAGYDVVERVRTVLQQYGPTGTAFGWRLWVECWSASLRDPELRAVVRSLDLGWRSVITGLLTEGARTGAVQCADPAASALRLTALLDGLAIQNVVFDAVVTTECIASEVNDALMREIGR